MDLHHNAIMMLVSSNLTIAIFLCIRTCFTTDTNVSYMGEPERIQFDGKCYKDHSFIFMQKDLNNVEIKCLGMIT